MTMIVHRPRPSTLLTLGGLQTPLTLPLQAVGRRRVAVVAALALCLTLARTVTAQDTATPRVAVTGAPTTRPSLGLSPDGSRLCVTWLTFGATADAFVRLQDTRTGAWQPPLAAEGVNVSEAPGENTASTRCAIDGAGTTHVVWAEGGSKRIQHRTLPAGRDPAVSGNWSPIVTVSTESDAQFGDLAAQFSDRAGTVWLAYVAEPDTGYYSLAEMRAGFVLGSSAARSHAD